MLKNATMREYINRNARQTDIPAIRAMQECSMSVLSGDFYAASEIEIFR